MKHGSRFTYEISVGYEGPTDACLVLTRRPDGRRKEFLIESLCWKLLAIMRRERIGIIPEICEAIMEGYTTNEENRDL